MRENVKQGTELGLKVRRPSDRRGKAAKRAKRGCKCRSGAAVGVLFTWPPPRLVWRNLLNPSGIRPKGAHDTRLGEDLGGRAAAVMGRTVDVIDLVVISFIDDIKHGST